MKQLRRRTLAPLPSSRKGAGAKLPCWWMNAQATFGSSLDFEACFQDRRRHELTAATQGCGRLAVS